MNGRRECEDIRDTREIWELYIYIYIYIIFLTYLYSYSINTFYHSVASNNLYFYYLCLIVCNVSGNVAMATRNHSQMAPIQEADTSRQTSESVYELDFDWFRKVLFISIAWNTYRHRVSIACFLSYCYTCINTWRKWHITLYNTRKTGVLLEFERYAVGYIC